MKQIPYIPFYVQDFIGSPDVKMMSMEEVGCYTTLLMNLYANGGVLPNDPDVLKRLCGGIAVASAVVRKFYVSGEFLRNERADEIIKKYREKSEKQSENANKRWGKPKSKAMPSHMPSHMPRQCQSESESNNKKEYKEKSFEHPIVQNLWKTLKDECEALGFKNEVNPTLFERTYYEFENKLPTGEGFAKQIRNCLFYHRDKGGKRVMRTATIRNWLLNAVKFAKAKDLKRQTAFQDQRHTQDSIKMQTREKPMFVKPDFPELEEPEETF